jgi:hypothetical protein
MKESVCGSQSSTKPLSDTCTSAAGRREVSHITERHQQRGGSIATLIVSGESRCADLCTPLRDGLRHPGCDGEVKEGVSYIEIAGSKDSHYSTEWQRDSNRQVR